MSCPPASSVHPLMPHISNSSPALPSSTAGIKPLLTWCRLKHHISEKQFCLSTQEEGCITTVYHVVWYEHSWPGTLLTKVWLSLVFHQPASPFKSRTEGFVLDRCLYNINIRSCWSTAWKTVYEVQNQSHHNYSSHRQKNLAPRKLQQTTLLMPGYTIKNKSKLQFL